MMILLIRVFGLSAVKCSPVRFNFIWSKPPDVNTMDFPVNLDSAWTLDQSSYLGETQYAAETGGWCETCSATYMKSLVMSS